MQLEGSTVVQKAGRREWIGLAVIALPCFLYAMDLTVLDLAVPRISADLRPTSAQFLWIVDIYGFVLAGLLITMGTLGDRIGRRKLLLLGAAFFGIASVFAAFSKSAEMLIASRALLGVAGATIAPSTLSLIRIMFADPRQRSTAIGVWVTSYSVGGAVGPLVGGVLLEHFWWGSVFLIGVPVMLLLLAVGPVLLPEFRDPNAGRMDLLSAALSLAAVLLVIYGIKQVAQDGIGLWAVLSIASGVVVGVIFVRRQLTLPDPLIDLKLFKIPSFSTALAAYTISTFVVFGFYLYITQYLQLVLGVSPLRTAVLMLPIFISFIVGAMVTPGVARHIRPTTIMCAGLCVAAIGFLLLARVSTTSGLALLVTALVLYAFGNAPVFTLTTDLIVGAAPPEGAGAASAISETGSELGGALGIAVMGSIGTAVYRGVMAHAIPNDIPLAAREAARMTLGGAVAIAHQLPAKLSVELLDAAREAFRQSMKLTSTLSAVVLVITAVMVVVTLRNVERRTSAD